jgi:hypothetical protein
MSSQQRTDAKHEKFAGVSVQFETEKILLFWSLLKMNKSGFLSSLVWMSLVPHLFAFCDQTGRFCVYGTTSESGHNVLTIHSAATGWAAIGIGSSMTSCTEMYLIWKNSKGELILSPRNSSSQAMPIYNHVSRSYLTDLQYQAPTWATLAASIVSPDRLDKNTLLIYALSNELVVSPEIKNSNFNQHDSHGQITGIDYPQSKVNSIKAVSKAETLPKAVSKAETLPKAVSKAETLPKTLGHRKDGWLDRLFGFPQQNIGQSSMGWNGQQQPGSTFGQQQPFNDWAGQAGSIGQQKPGSSWGQQQPGSSWGQQQPGSSWGQQQPASSWGQQQPASSWGNQRPGSSWGGQQPSSGWNGQSWTGQQQSGNTWGGQQPSAGWNGQSWTGQQQPVSSWNGQQSWAGQRPQTAGVSQGWTGQSGAGWTGF